MRIAAVKLACAPARPPAVPLWLRRSAVTKPQWAVGRSSQNPAALLESGVPARPTGPGRAPARPARRWRAFGRVLFRSAAWGRPPSIPAHLPPEPGLLAPSKQRSRRGGWQVVHKGSRTGRAPPSCPPIPAFSLPPCRVCSPLRVLELLRAAARVPFAGDRPRGRCGGRRSGAPGSVKRRAAFTLAGPSNACSVFVESYLPQSSIFSPALIPLQSLVRTNSHLYR